MYTRTRNAQRGASSGRLPGQLAATRRTTASGRRPLPARPVRFRQRPPQKTGFGKAVQGIAGRLPGSTARTKSRPTGGGRKGPAGLALLAGAAGVAFKYRERLTSLLARNRSGDAVEPSVTGPRVDSPTPTVGGEPAQTHDAGKEAG
jgi:hypothetical protein